MHAAAAAVGAVVGGVCGASSKFVKQNDELKLLFAFRILNGFCGVFQDCHKPNFANFLWNFGMVHSKYISTVGVFPSSTVDLPPHESVS